MAQTQIPPTPQPRTDLPSPAGISDAEYQAYVEMLTEEPVGAWRDQDGMLYLARMPASMAPASVRVDSAVALAPDDPNYGTWVDTVQPEYDFMSPTKVAPQPVQKEVPDAASTDDDAAAGGDA